MKTKTSIKAGGASRPSGSPNHSAVKIKTSIKSGGSITAI